MQPSQPAVSPEILGQLALACRDQERIRFHYVAADGAETDRLVEPHSLVSGGRHWFLVCWDLRRDDWRTFRVDRLSSFFGTRLRFEPRELPADDAAAFVATALGSLRTRVTASVVMQLPIADMLGWFGPWAQDAESVDAQTTRWPLGGADMYELFSALVWIPPGVEYRIEGNDELVAFVREVAGRMTRAVS